MLGNRTKWVVGASIIAVSLAVSGVAIATGPTGSVVSAVLGAGSTDEKFEFRAKPDTNTVVASFTFGPNSSTGWHTHPGRTLVTIKSGTFTVYHAEDCAPMVYEPGDAFVELPSTVHVGRNETTGTVELESCSSRYRSAVALGSTNRSRELRRHLDNTNDRRSARRLTHRGAGLRTGPSALRFREALAREGRLDSDASGSCIPPRPRSSP